jgi:hypothetical protein
MDRVGPTIVGRRSTPGVGAARSLFVASAVGEGATSIALVHSYLGTLDEDRQ